MHQPMCNKNPKRACRLGGPGHCRGCPRRPPRDSLEAMYGHHPPTLALARELSRPWHI